MPLVTTFDRVGGPEVLRFIDEPTPKPGPDQVVVRHTAIGVNYIDVYHRDGTYPVPLPASIGMDAAGVVEQRGSEVRGLEVGARVAYLRGLDEPGTYRDYGVVSVERVVPLPDGISDREAAAILAKGVTAVVLLRVVRPVRAGETVLIHAAAGGTGIIMCQLAHAAGAKVIGTVSTDHKAEVAREYGCQHPIVYSRERFPDRVRELTGGVGASVVFDSVGAATFEGSLDCLEPYGTLVSFGSSSGRVEAIDPMELRVRGSLSFTCATTFTELSQPGALARHAEAVFEAVRAGDVTAVIDSEFALKDAGDAHRRLEARRTVGSLLLRPGRGGELDSNASKPGA